MIEEQFQHFLVAKSNSSKCNMSAVTLVQNNAIIHILVTVVDQLKNVSGKWWYNGNYYNTLFRVEALHCIIYIISMILDWYWTLWNLIAINITDWSFTQIFESIMHEERMDVIKDPQDSLHYLFNKWTYQLWLDI